MAAISVPCTVDDEPKDSWTIEQVMNWWLWRAHGESDAAYEQIVESLTKQLEHGKKSLVNDHEKVSNMLDGKTNPNENHDPQTNVVKTIDESNAKPKVQVVPKQDDAILIEIQTGDYEGQTYKLHPKARSHCWVGRSQGKKFREKGISLPKDLEVSTTHGRFELLRNQLVYVDTGSTNGSRLADIDIAPNSPVVLESGMHITVGQTVMKVTLL
ncbi:unnamed protein product [Cylindrotheca closterium]|uniref:FHA domain-containing protein n=1 Tax=Cylindrotheca closterium TaxID=2856 RepID=A0AAD2FK57_9STRA|nr:unnamed protein product [Cylindrotheca closterium]